MASSVSEVSKGAKKRTVLPGRFFVANGIADIENESKPIINRNNEDGRDSGLSSESSTPTGGSPVPRQRKPTSNPINIVNSSLIPRMKTYSRIESDKTSKVWRSRNMMDSPTRSLDGTRNRQFTSPFRSSRNIHSPGLDSGEESNSRLERETYQHMFHDIVSIKTMLLKLKRVLQESEENSLTRAETLNPFDNSVKNGLFYNLNEGNTADVGTSPGSGGSSIADELADLRRQVVFLQGQVEDKDRTIQVLQFQMSKLQGPTGTDGQNSALTIKHSNIPSANTCNAATQTDKTRPLSAGPSLLQTLPQDGVMGPLVSWSDSWDRQRPSLLTELKDNTSFLKSTDRLPRTITRHQEETLRLQNVHGNRLSAENPSCRTVLESKDSKPFEFRSIDQRDIKREGNPIKSYIATTRKHTGTTSSSLIPRTTRTVPHNRTTGRSHNT